MSAASRCPRCKGNGIVAGVKCEECDGRGRIESSQGALFEPLRAAGRKLVAANRAADVAVGLSIDPFEGATEAELAGISWWNDMPPETRVYWLKRAGADATPAEARDAYMAALLRPGGEL